MSLLDKFPLQRFKIKNNSMFPTINEREEVLTVRYLFQRPKVGDIIVFRQVVPPFVLCKRIKKIVKNKMWVEGDNKKESIDSRMFGFIDRKNIIGKVILKI